MRSLFKSIATIALAVPLTFAGTAVAEDVEGDIPDAQVFMSGQSISAVLGAGSGGGRLVHKGDQYPFRMGGGSFGISGGISATKASGEVYNLKRVADFPGKYEGTSASLTAVAGAGGAWYKNDKGVVLNLRTEKIGAEINLSAGNFTIEVEESTLERMKSVDAASGN